MSNPSAATLKIKHWREHPIDFVRDNFGVEPDKWQAEVLQQLGQPGRKRVAMKSCAGPGKTAVLGWSGWHRLACYAGKGEHPKGAAVSINSDNLRDNLWSELAKWQARSKFLSAAFTWSKERIVANDHPETWFLSARGWSKSADLDTIGRTLSGLHSQYPFYLIDESGDMPSNMIRSAEQGLTTCTDGLIITAGNTTSVDGLLYFVCSTVREQWHVVTITADPDDVNRTPRVDAEWARQQIELYGRENPWVMSFILGEFPTTALNSLLSIDEVEAAMKRFYREDAYDWAQKRLGVDVARFGDDRTVIFPRQGLVAMKPTIMRIARTTDIAAKIAVIKTEFNSEVDLVDDTGHWGHGVIDNLITAGFNPVGIQFHGPALDPRYKNRRAEMWIGMSEWVKKGGMLPPMPELIPELITPTYFFNNGKLQLEDKDMIKKRLGRSPDLADALALTFAIPDQPKSNAKMFTNTNKQFAKTDYDIFA